MVSFACSRLQRAGQVRGSGHPGSLGRVWSPQAVTGTGRVPTWLCNKTKFFTKITVFPTKFTGFFTNISTVPAPSNLFAGALRALLASGRPICATCFGDHILRRSLLLHGMGTGPVNRAPFSPLGRWPTSSILKIAPSPVQPRMTDFRFVF
jgi:hypothetical protein